MWRHIIHAICPRIYLGMMANDMLPHGVLVVPLDGVLERTFL
jgi:hypothetical protein